MPKSDRQVLRLVIQHIGRIPSARSSYRLIGYSDEHTYRPADFDSLDDLLEALNASMPAFDASGISRERHPTTSILFADVVEFSAAQLSTLGLKE